MIEQAATHLWQSTLVAAVAGLLTLAFKSNRAQVRYGLWLAASLKFLVPFAPLIALGQQFGWLAPRPIGRLQMTVVSPAFTQPLPQPEAAAVAAASIVPPGAVAALTIGLLTVWAGGCALMLGVWCVRWARVALAVRRMPPITGGRELDTLRRLEQRAGRAPRIGLVASDGSLEPGVFGILRPVLLWPRAIGAHFGDQEVEAILAHELSHVRRHDNLAAAVHTVVQAVFWFHPLVWWVGARLVDERERACDEDVIRLGSEPHVYAGSLLKTCALYLESPLACVSGVTGGGLTPRIEAIMRGRAANPLTAVKKITLATAGMVAIVVPLTLGVLTSPPLQAFFAGAEPHERVRLQRAITDLRLRARTMRGRASAFEVVSITPNTSGGSARIQALMSRSADSAAGQVTLTNMPVREVIRIAYGLQPFQISGGPSWIHTAGYDIVVNGDVPAGPDHVGRMLSALLADRFKLRMHHEPRVMPLFTLVKADNGTPGPRLRRSQEDCSLAAAASAPCGTWAEGPAHVAARGVTMEQLAKRMTAISQRVNRVVVDRTGLAGTFDLDLQFFRPLDAGLAGFPTVTALLEQFGLMTSVFTAVREQLGLELEEHRGPVDVMVIDGAERPTDLRSRRP